MEAPAWLATSGVAVAETTTVCGVVASFKRDGERFGLGNCYLAQICAANPGARTSAS